MLIHFWEKFPKVYDYIQILATGGFLKKVSEELKFMNDQSIMDIGCGTGTLVEYINPKEYLGVDLNPDFIKLARKKYPQYDFKVLNIVTQKFPEKKFKFIFIMNVLHHLTDTQIGIMLTKIKKTALFDEFIIVESKPRNLIGKILGRFDAGSNFRKYDDLKEIVKKNFKIKKSKVISAPIGTYEYLIARCVKN